MSTVPGKSLYILYIVTEETWISSGVMYISDVSKSTENWEGLPNIIWATNANHIYNFKFSKSHNEKKKREKRVPWWLRGLKIWHCLGLGTGSIPGPRKFSMLCLCPKKKKKSKKENMKLIMYFI